MKLAIGSLPMILLAAGTAHAGWVRCAETLDIANYENSTDEDGYATATVSAQADGFSMQVFGGAVDVIGTMDEAGAGATAPGSHYECWKFEPTREGQIGEVEYSAHLRIKGVAELIDANCAGVAAGVERADVFVNGKLRDSAVVMLDDSAGETVGGVLGPVGMKIPGPWGITIPAALNISFGSGAGTYKDEDEKAFSRAVCPAQTYEFATQVESVGRVWADEDIALEAVVAIRAKGTIENQSSLLEWPGCPAGSAP